MQNDKGDTALTSAIRKGNLDIAKLLINNNANLYLHLTKYGSALQLAISGKHTDIINMITKKLKKIRTEQLFTLYEKNKIIMHEYYELPIELKYDIIGYLLSV